MKNFTFYAMLLAFMISIKAFPDDIYWTGNDGDEDWFNPLNWSPAQVPTASDAAYFPVMAGNEVVVIENNTAYCQALYFAGQNYTLEIEDDGVFEVSDMIQLTDQNTFYNRGVVNVTGDFECTGFVDNNFGGELTINGTFQVDLPGLVSNTGNAVHASLIETWDMVNNGEVNNEDMSTITIINTLNNYGDFTNFNSAVMNSMGTLFNYGNLSFEKKSELYAAPFFENHGMFISEDKAIIDGNSALVLTNYGTIQNIDQSEFVNIVDLINYGTINNEDKADLILLENMENHGDVINDSYMETGLGWSNFDGSTLTNTDVIYCQGDFYDDGVTDNQLDLTVDGQLSVDVNGQILNTGCFILNGNAGIEGQYVGSLLNYGSISGTGTYSYNRDTGGTGVTAAFEGWHYISTPVGGMSCHHIFDYYINDWDETNNTWYNYSPSGSGCVAGPDNPFDLMKGYSIKRELDYACNAVNPATGSVVEFTGSAAQVHTGNQSIMVSGSDFQPGDPDNMNNWNLVGNPFPSAVDAGSISFPAEIDNAIYYYDDATLSYEAYVGGVGQPFIPVAQGFFVHVNTPGTWSFDLDNTTRVCDGSDNWYKSQSTNVLEIAVHDKKGLGDKTYFRKLEAATRDFDKKWDAYKLLTDLPEVPQIYSKTNNIRYAINAMDQADELPLFFKCGETGYYTITVDGLDDFDLVYLEDRTTGILHDLKTKPWYTFVAEQSDHSARFVLHFEEYAEGLEDQGFIIYSKNKCIYLKNQRDLSGDIVVINSVGQVIVTTRLQSGLNRIQLNQPEGIYIVRALTPTYTVNKKVFYH
ncbi:MAG: T9SS type A sorting domain-containing protein [Bacteroidetes bacterium]|nr:T9SS type A sorting domain-containing protein [Bacteroidota bacterium]